MLHILWIIIKFILILLGILLGLILLAVLLVLFCPVRYRVSVSKETESFKETEASGKISWLFGGVSYRFWFKDGQKGKEFRLFGLPVLKMLRNFKNRRTEGGEEPQEQKHRKRKKSKSRSGEEAPEIKEISGPDTSGEEQTEERKTEETSSIEQASAGKIPEETDEQTIKKSQEIKKKEEEESFGDEQEEAYGSADETSDSAANSFFYKLGNKVRSLLEKLKRIGARLGAIPAGIRRFKLTIENIYAKINWWKRFLTHPRIQAALVLVKDELIRLLKHMFPTKIEGKITFSCTDPSVTGTILAVLGATIPLHKNCIQVNPQFEDRNMVMGSARLKGRIYGIVLVVTALKIYFNKDIKYTIKIWKKHKED